MSTNRVGAVVGAFAVALLLTITADAALAQQSARVSGRVTHQQTGEPLVGARVILIGTNQSVETDRDGRYQFQNVASQRVSLRVIAIGFETQQQGVVLGGDQTAEANFQMEPLVVVLDQVVVTATGEQRRREVANDIANIDVAKEIERGAITDFSDLLSARASGVYVSPASGTTGSGTKVRVRGANSLSLTNEPLLYVDGIRVDNTAASFGLNSIAVGGQEPSRLNDINPEEIESIEIVKGPSAATLYGTEAANGVIVINTKRGTPGETRWNMWLEGGIIQDHNAYPTNFDAIDTDGNPGCALVFVEIGACVQDSIQSFNVLEDSRTTPIGLGNRQQFGLNVSGGTDRLSYFVSGEYEREVGTLRLPDSTKSALLLDRGELPSNLVRPNEMQRVNLRVNLRSQLSDNLDLTTSVGYVTSDVRLPQNDNNVLGMLPSGFFGGATEDAGFGFFSPQEVFSIRAEQELERFIASARVNWQAFPWLEARGVMGLDLTNQFDNDFTPTGEVPFGTRIDGQRNSNRIQVYQYTVDLGASARAAISDEIGSRTSVGVQYFQNINTGTFAFGERLPSGSSSLNGAVVTQAFEATAENITVGSFLEQMFSLNDRLFITGAFRVDDNNSFGEDFNAIAYPKASASWVISEEPFFPTGSGLSSLRLRAAWGQTGVQPNQNAAVRFFNPVAVTVGGIDVVGVSDSSFGNVDLKAERSEEIEVGFDAGLFNDRVRFDVTYYNKNTEDALVSRNLAPSLGTSSTRFVNLASVRNRGFEGVVSAQVIQTRNVEWDLAFRGTTVDNEVLDLGEDVEPIIFGLGGNTQRHEAGFPAGAYFQNPILSFADENGDGIITLNEVEVGDEPEFIGTPIPKRQLSIQSSVTLWNRIRLSGLLDHKGGHHLFNGTEQFRCSQFFLCEAAVVPGSDLQQQAATVAQALHPSGTFAGFIEPASFWKLREASVTLFAPDSWAGWLRAQRLSLTISGRNLFTITDYKGVDPEVISSQVGNFSTSDFLTQPEVRYWTARLNVTF